MYPAAGNEVQWWRDLITPNIDKNKKQFLLLFTGKNRAKASSWTEQKESSYLLILHNIIFTYTLHRYLFYLSIIFWWALGLPLVSWWGLAGIHVSTILLQQLNPPSPSCCLWLLSCRHRNNWIPVGCAFLSGCWHEAPFGLALALWLLFEP